MKSTSSVSLGGLLVSLIVSVVARPDWSGPSTPRPNIVFIMADEDVTVAEVLKQAGYQTGGVGKWSLGDAGTVGRATNQGFDTWLGYLIQDHAHYYYTEYLDDDEGRLKLPGNRQTQAHYSHNLLTDRALGFIRQASQNAEPFFLYVAYTLPHFSSRTEDKDGLAVPTTQPYTDRAWDERSKKYAAMIHLLDRDVGRIVDLVDRSGLKGKTLIVLTSDNGPHGSVAKRFNSNGPLRGFKRDLNEGGIRVPFLVRWPGTVPANQTSTIPVAFQDMMPTFAQLAGVAVPGSVDGVSVVDVLNGSRIKPHDRYFYWDYGHCRQRYDQAVRWKHWKGIRRGRDNKIELYNLSTDPGEARNVASEHPRIVARIEQIMKSVPAASDRYPIGQLYRGSPLWTPR